MKIILSFFLYFLSFPLFSAQWTGSTSGAWLTGTNWTNPATAPNTIGAEALMTNASAANTGAITLGGTITIGKMELDLGPPNTPYNISGGTLRFQTSSGNSNIIVSSTNGSLAHEIAAAITIVSDLVITQNIADEFTISGNISGSSLEKSGTGTLVLTGTNTSLTQLTLSSGTLKVNTDDQLGTLGNTLSIGSGVLVFDMTGSSNRPISLTGDGGINATGGVEATIQGLISGTGSLTIGDTGTVILDHSNTYEGGTLISSGTLRISSNENLGADSGGLSFGSGTLDITQPITIPRSGSITGTSAITSTTNVTLSGNFSGGGELIFSGGGTFTLPGTNSYTGGTVVGNGTQIAGTTNGIQGDIQLNTATSFVTFSQNFDGTHSGSITSAVLGAGVLTKLGTGTVTLEGSSPGFTGSVTIEEGTLNVDGTLGGALTPITVNSNGTLGGIGTVGPVSSTGTLDPGNGDTVGTLNITGALQMLAGNQTVINISPLGADQIAVSSTALLTGPLTIEPTAGFYGFSADYTILTSTGITSTFSPVTSTVLSFVPTVTYSATSVFLHLDITEPFGVFPFSNFNTAAVGNNIDELFAAGQLTPDLLDTFTLFVGQSNSTINSALDQMHPAPYSALVDQQTEVAAQIISLFHRLPDLPCTCSNPNRFWIEPFGSSLTVKRHGIQIGYQGNSGGIALGYDGEIAPNWIFGFGTAWSTTHLDWHDHRGKATMNGFYGAAYTDYQWGDFYFGAAFLSGLDFYDTERNIQFLNVHRKADASFKSVDVVAQIKSAYLFGSPQAFFYPYFNLDYIYLATEQFKEYGADSLSLTVFDRGDGTLRTEVGLGLKVQDTNPQQTICIAPEVNFGFVNMSHLQSPHYQAHFEGVEIPFKAKGWDKTWNLLHVDFGLSIAYCCFNLGVKYQVELSPDSDTLYYNQYGNLQFDWKW